MKILLADPDRDLLMTYKALLELEGFEVTTAFDGTQVITRSVQTRFDLAVMDRRLPRIDIRLLMKALLEADIPVLMLVDHKITPADLLDENAACAYMSFPFVPSELIGRVKEIIGRSKDGGRLEVGGISIDRSRFREKNGMRFTNEEITLLDSIMNGKKPDTHRISTYINTLNNRFERLKSSARIKYVIKEGYRVVSDHE